MGLQTRVLGKRMVWKNGQFISYPIIDDRMTMYEAIIDVGLEPGVCTKCSNIYGWSLEDHPGIGACWDCQDGDVWDALYEKTNEVNNLINE